MRSGSLFHSWIPFFSASVFTPATIVSAIVRLSCFATSLIRLISSSDNRTLICDCRFFVIGLPAVFLGLFSNVPPPFRTICPTQIIYFAYANYYSRFTQNYCSGFPQPPAGRTLTPLPQIFRKQAIYPRYSSKCQFQPFKAVFSRFQPFPHTNTH